MRPDVVSQSGMMEGTFLVLGSSPYKKVEDIKVDAISKYLKFSVTIMGHGLVRRPGDPEGVWRLPEAKPGDNLLVLVENRGIDPIEVVVSQFGIVLVLPSDKKYAGVRLVDLPGPAARGWVLPNGSFSGAELSWSNLPELFAGKLNPELYDFVTHAGMAPRPGLGLIFDVYGPYKAGWFGRWKPASSPLNVGEVLRRADEIWPIQGQHLERVEVRFGQS